MNSNEKKARPALIPTHISLPTELGDMTVNQLINDDNTEVYKKKNKLSMRRKTEFGIATLEIESYDTGRNTICQTTVPHREKKKDYLDDILAMKQQKVSQKEIAFKLGLSESYVSKLLKEC